MIRRALVAIDSIPTAVLVALIIAGAVLLAFAPADPR